MREEYAHVSVAKRDRPPNVLAEKGWGGTNGIPKKKVVSLAISREKTYRTRRRASDRHSQARLVLEVAPCR